MAVRTLPGTPKDTAPLVELGRPLPLRAYLRDLWSRRQLIVAIPLGDLKAQNRDSLLGGLWHLLNPLLLAAVYYLIFGIIFDAGGRGDVDNFVGFLTIGVFTYYYTSKSITAGARSVVNNEGLIRSIRFPRAVLPVSAVLGEAAALVFSVSTMLAVVLLTGERPEPVWLLLVPALALQTMFNLGVALGIARATAHFRDVEQLLPFLLRIWLYFSGVFYVIDDRVAGIPVLHALLQWNPAHTYITLVRAALLDGAAPGRQWLAAVGWGVVALVVGFIFFWRHEGEYGRG